MLKTQRQLETRKGTSELSRVTPVYDMWKRSSHLCCTQAPHVDILRIFSAFCPCFSVLVCLLYPSSFSMRGFSSVVGTLLILRSLLDILHIYSVPDVVIIICGDVVCCCLWSAIMSSFLFFMSYVFLHLPPVPTSICNTVFVLWATLSSLKLTAVSYNFASDATRGLLPRSKEASTRAKVDAVWGVVQQIAEV